jgi:magnesium transporter
MIRTMICSENRRLKKELRREEIGLILSDDENVLWLDVESPTDEEIALLGKEFMLHELAVEDVTRRRQRPKIDVYDDYYLLVCYDIDYDETNDQIDEHELHVIIGKNYLLTIHHEPIEEIAEVATRFRRNTDAIERGIGVLLYSLLDTIVDHYFPVIDRIGERIEELETGVFIDDQTETQQAMQSILVLKREMITMRRVIAPQRDAMAVLARRELPIVSEAAGVYFQDLYEHVLRVTDALDVYRDLLGGVLDSYLSVNSNKLAIAANNLNAVMKTLASYSIILMTVTLVAGIYGMNFDHMPELHFRYGYPLALLAMLAIFIALRKYFKRRDWL